MESDRLNGNGNWNYNYTQFCNDHYYYGNGVTEEEEVDPLVLSCNGGGADKNKSHFVISTTNNYPFSSSSSSSTIITTPISKPSPPPPIAGGFGFIEHPVSKFDTLAGVAIKYGVEVADIKKSNGLVTDLQMFALKSLQIPLPGRHPPSPGLSNGSDTSRQSTSQQTTPSRVRSDFFDSFQSLRLNSSQQEVSPAMSSLQGYYGLKSVMDPKISQGFEMVDYKNGDSHYLEDVRYLRPSPASNTPLSLHRKSRSINGFLDENNGVADDQLIPEAREGDTERWNEKLVRRRQKSDADFSSSYPEMLLNEDMGGGVSSAITGKSLALRFNAANRTSLPLDAEAGGLTPAPIGVGDSSVALGLSSVRKSSSTSSLNDQDSSSSSIWSTSKWSLKPELQAFSAAAIARPIFDGLPKPITGRRNKAAID